MNGNECVLDGNGNGRVRNLVLLSIENLRYTWPYEHLTRLGQLLNELVGGFSLLSVLVGELLVLVGELLSVLVGELVRVPLGEIYL